MGWVNAVIWLLAFLATFIFLLACWGDDDPIDYAELERIEREVDRMMRERNDRLRD